MKKILLFLFIMSICTNSFSQISSYREIFNIFGEVKYTVETWSGSIHTTQRRIVELTNGLYFVELHDSFRQNSVTSIVYFNLNHNTEREGVLLYPLPNTWSSGRNNPPDIMYHNNSITIKVSSFYWHINSSEETTQSITFYFNDDNKLSHYLVGLATYPDYYERIHFIYDDEEKLIKLYNDIEERGSYRNPPRPVTYIYYDGQIRSFEDIPYTHDEIIVFDHEKLKYHIYIHTPRRGENFDNQCIILEYNQNGNLIKWRREFRNGIFREYEHQFFEYDEKGNWTKMSKYWVHLSLDLDFPLIQVSLERVLVCE